MTFDERREIARKIFEEIPYVRHLGMRLSELEKGFAVVEMDFAAHLQQNRGLLHGGATASLIDTATAFAVASMLGEGESASTVEMTVHYLRPVTFGKISAEAKILRAGKRLFTVNADVSDSDGRIVATSLATYSKLISE